jgi:hypothetical protein
MAVGDCVTRYIAQVSEPRKAQFVCQGRSAIDFFDDRYIAVNCYRADFDSFTGKTPVPKLLAKKPKTVGKKRLNTINNREVREGWYRFSYPRPVLLRASPRPQLLWSGRGAMTLMELAPGLRIFFLTFKYAVLYSISPFLICALWGNR